MMLVSCLPTTFVLFVYNCVPSVSRSEVFPYHVWHLLTEQLYFYHHLPDYAYVGRVTLRFQCRVCHAP